jgi:hypothetical protein
VGAFRTVLAEPPVTTPFEFEALDYQLVASPPSLREQLRIRHGAPDALA